MTTRFPSVGALFQAFRRRAAAFPAAADHLRDRTLSMGEVAAYLRLDKSSVTGLVGRAEQRGFLRRERRHEDGRGVQVLITECGLELSAQIQAEVADRVLAFTQTLSADERTNLTELIDRVVNVI